MVVAGVIALCVLLVVLAFLAPRLSRHPERGAQGVLGLGRRAGSSAPGALGRWLSKPFSKGQKATGKSASLGRRGRGKMPL